MATYTDKELILFLLSCSRRSLGNFLLSRLDVEQKLRKEFLQKVSSLFDQIVDRRAEVRLANLIRDHGEAILEELGGSRDRADLFIAPGRRDYPRGPAHPKKMAGRARLKLAAGSPRLPSDDSPK